MEYQHGGDIYSHSVEMDYSANLNPLGLPEGVKRALEQCLEDGACELYPDSSARSLRRALARFHGLPPEWIICGNGAADLIFALVLALRPRRALVCAPGFLEYRQALAAWGCRTDTFFLRKEEAFALDAAALAQSVREAAGAGDPYELVFLCNPNNPTGLSVGREEVLALAAACAPQTILAVDECFCDFLERPQLHSVIPFLGENRNLFVLKAFTKLYAMAGLRLGYGLGADRGLLERIAAVRQPWPVSGPAQRAGLAALEEEAYVRSARTLIAQERRFLDGRLRRLGLCPWPSEANYLFFRDGEGEEGQLYEELLAGGVLIRSCANYEGLDGHYYRICVKTHAENERFLQRLEAVMGARPARQRHGRS